MNAGPRGLPCSTEGSRSFPKGLPLMVPCGLCSGRFVREELPFVLSTCALSGAAGLRNAERGEGVFALRLRAEDSGRDNQCGAVRTSSVRCGEQKPGM